MTASGEARIRPYRESDRQALFDICTQTGDASQDATGLLSRDELWGLLFSVPYAQRHPDLAWVVAIDDEPAIGYVVATDDTEAFETWFHDEWWPGVNGPFPRTEHPQTREERLVAEAYRRGPGRQPEVAAYPAHLHINLLPSAQGAGWGRKLISTVFDELQRRQVPALHLGVDPRNTNAFGFYERMGMHRVPSPGESVTYGIRWADQPRFEEGPRVG